MKLNKPRFWDSKKSLLAIFLFPLTLVTTLITYLRRITSKPISFKIPVICIGNIYIGGTGKTPSAIFLAHELKKIGKNPVIVKKYYKNQKDEQSLIKKYFNNLILNKKRSDAIYEAERKGFDSVILDDGFQDFNIKKDLNIICFNQNQLIGNGFILPSGPLRQSLNSLNDAEIILINGNKDVEFEKKILKINKRLNIFYTEYTPNNIEDFKKKGLFAVAGIGNPNNFFDLLEKYGLNIKKRIVYPDHYNFSEFEIFKLIYESDKKDYQIITTEKDYMRIKKFNLEKIKFLNISLNMKYKNEFLKKVISLYDKKS